MCIHYTTTTITKLPSKTCVCVLGRGVAHYYVEVSGTLYASHTLLVGKETHVFCG